MNILQLAKEINYELLQLRSSYRGLIAEREVADIFDSVVTSVTDNLANSFTFTIYERRNPAHIAVKWEYDLTDKQKIERSGPATPQILSLLKRIPPDIMGLTCDVEWSDTFFELDRASQDQIMRASYWGKKSNLQKKPDPTDPRPEKLLDEQSGASLDLEALELDLIKLETEAGYITKEDRMHIFKSVKKCVEAGYCRGVQFKVLDSERSHSLVEWQFELVSPFKLARSGDSQTRVLTILKELKSSQQPLDIKPLVRSKFEKMSAKEQQKVMSDTVWADSFKKKGGILNIFS